MASLAERGTTVIGVGYCGPSGLTGAGGARAGFGGGDAIAALNAASASATIALLLTITVPQLPAC